MKLRGAEGGHDGFLKTVVAHYRFGTDRRRMINEISLFLRVRRVFLLLSNRSG